MLLKYPSCWLSSLDKTAQYLIAARSTSRPWQKQVPAQSRKRSLTSAAHHSQPTSETTSISQSGSIAPRPPGQIGSYMAAGPHHSFNQIRGSRSHRELFRLVWKHRSKAASHQPKGAPETIARIREMAVKNRLWGAESIRGELLRLGMHVCKRTVQKGRLTRCALR